MTEYRYTRHMWHTVALALACCSTALGCLSFRLEEGKAASPVPLNVALADMELNLSRINVFVLSDAQRVNKDPSAMGHLRQVIANLQCYDIDPVSKAPNAKLRTRNPLLPIITGALQIQVQGQISEAGTFTVSATPSAGGTLTHQAQQQLMVPLSLVSVANLANFYIGQQTANLQYLTLVTGLPPDDSAQAAAQKSKAAGYVSAVMTSAETISGVVGDAFRAFDKQADYCKGRDGGNGPPVVLGTGSLM